MGVGMGMDMGMGMGMPAAAPTPGSFAPFTAFNKNGLLITFTCSKDPANPSVTSIETTFTNSTPAPIGNLNFQVAVPKYMKLQMSPASSTTVPPNNAGNATQIFKVANSMQGQKGVLVRIKLDYSVNGQMLSETGQVDQFPAGV